MFFFFFRLFFPLSFLSKIQRKVLPVLWPKLSLGQFIFYVFLLISLKKVSMKSLTSANTRVTLKLLTPSSWMKMKDLFINSKFNHFKAFTMGVESFFTPFKIKTRKEEKSQLFEGVSTPPFHHDQLPFESKLPFPAFFFNFENRREYRVDRWLSWSGRRNSRKPVMFRKQLSKASQEWLWTDADQNDSFSDSSYLFPIQRILQN